MVDTWRKTIWYVNHAKPKFLRPFGNTNKPMYKTFVKTLSDYILKQAEYNTVDRSGF